MQNPLRLYPDLNIEVHMGPDIVAEGMGRLDMLAMYTDNTQILRIRVRIRILENLDN